MTTTRPAVAVGGWRRKGSSSILSRGSLRGSLRDARRRARGREAANKRSGSRVRREPGSARSPISPAPRDPAPAPLPARRAPLRPGAGPRAGPGAGRGGRPWGGRGGRRLRRLRWRLEKSCPGQSARCRGIRSRRGVTEGAGETTGSAAGPADSQPGVAPGHGTAGGDRGPALRPGRAEGGLSCRDAGCAPRARPPGRWRRCAGR